MCALITLSTLGWALRQKIKLWWPKILEHWVQGCIDTSDKKEEKHSKKLQNNIKLGQKDQIWAENKRKWLCNFGNKNRGYQLKRGTHNSLIEFGILINYNLLKL